MMAIVPLILKYWPEALAGLAAVAVLAYVSVLKSEISHNHKVIAADAAQISALKLANSAEHATVDALAATNATNQAVCAAASRAAQANVVIAKAEASASAARAAQYGGLLDAIAKQPPDATPVAPVVRTAVDGVWQRLPAAP